MALFNRNNPTRLFSSYPVRMMVSLAASLLVIALCFRLPLDVPPDRIGWKLAPHVQQPMLELIEIKEKPPEDGSGVPIHG